MIYPTMSSDEMLKRGKIEKQLVKFLNEMQNLGFDYSIVLGTNFYIKDKEGKNILNIILCICNSIQFDLNLNEFDFPNELKIKITDKFIEFLNSVK